MHLIRNLHKLCTTLHLYTVCVMWHEANRQIAEENMSQNPAFFFLSFFLFFLFFYFQHLNFINTHFAQIR